MDAHIRERADRFYKDYVDPEYRGAYQQLCEAIAKQEAKGESYSLFGSRNSVIERIETGRRQAPGGKLLANPDLYPVCAVGQILDLPLLAHGGTARPPYAPSTRDLDGGWFLLHGLSHPWAGMAGMGALIGGGIFHLFPRI